MEVAQAAGTATESLTVNEGVVFDVQRFSLHDGPGIRTVVFLKGCPLECQWCSNPESQSVDVELLHSASRCKLCGRCAEACPTGAIQVDADGWRLERDACDACGRCVPVCLNEALRAAGRTMTVEELVGVVRRDAVFYRRSGGGVTFSGGEPLMQAGFVSSVMRRCRQLGYHTAVETSGLASEVAIDAVAEHCRLFLFDIKHTDDGRHRALTGVSNRLILSNFRRLVAGGHSVILRMPLIAGCNDDEANLRGVARLAEETGVGDLHVLPYHRLGEGKYAALDRRYALKGLKAPDLKQMDAVASRLQALAPHVRVRVIRGAV